MAKVVVLVHVDADTDTDTTGYYVSSDIHPRQLKPVLFTWNEKNSF